LALAVGLKPTTGLYRFGGCRFGPPAGGPRDG
jgi:hypothetical protein